MAPKTPVQANFPIPPPSAAIAIGRTADGRDVFFSIAGLELIQAIWAAIQGQGGMFDLAYLTALEVDDPSDSSASGNSGAVVASLLSGDDAQADSVSQLTLMQSLAMGSTGDTAESAAPIPTLTIPANITTHLSPPLPATLSAILDKIIGNARGSLIVRGAAVWQVLPLGANGTKLTSNGTDATWV